MTQNQVIISALPPAPAGTGSASSKGTDLFPATDVTNTLQSPGGQTNKYTLSEIFNFMLSAQGLVTYPALQVATTIPLTATYSNGSSGVGASLTNATTQAALVIDGVTLAVGSTVLVKNQTSTFQNGYYTVSNIGSSSSNWVMVRSTNYNMPAQIIQNGVVLVNQGTTNAGLLFEETAPGPFTIGTSAITYSPYSVTGITLPLSLANGGTGASLSVVDSAVFSVNSGGTTVLSPTLPSGLTIPGFASSGANDDITSMIGLTGVLQAPTAVTDVNGLEIVTFGSVGATAVNYINLNNTASANPPQISARGSDASIGLSFIAKSTGVFTFTTTASADVFVIRSGTASQHVSAFNFANTASTDTYTWPDASGTILLTTGAQQLAASSSLKLDKGTGTESSNAVTISKQSGVITTTSLTTAQYATETITLTNTLITTSSVVLASIMGGLNTTAGITVSATAGNGTSTITLTNLNSSALNGTVIIGFAVF